MVKRGDRVRLTTQVGFISEELPREGKMIVSNS